MEDEEYLTMHTVDGKVHRTKIRGREDRTIVFDEFGYIGRNPSWVRSCEELGDKLATATDSVEKLGKELVKLDDGRAEDFGSW